MALAAVFISACALYVSIQEMRVMRLQQRVSVYPHLQLTQTYTDKGFAIEIENVGTGLARIQSVQLTDGARYFNNWPEVVAYFLPDSLAFGYDVIQSNTISGNVLPAGKKLTLFGVEWLPGVREMEEQMRDLRIRILYSSLLNETWALTNDGLNPLDKAPAINPARELR